MPPGTSKNGVDISGQSYYSGIGGNAAHISAEDFLVALHLAKADYEKDLTAGLSAEEAYYKAVTGVPPSEALKARYQATADTNHSGAHPKPTVPHFRYEEFLSRNDPERGVDIPQQYWGNLQQLMDALEVIRTALGNIPLRINSGYRSPTHNKKVGGVANSQHLRALAADIACRLPPTEVADTIERLIQDNKIPEGGLGRYNTFTHYDVAGKKRRWDNRT